MSGDIPTELGNLILLKNLDIRKCAFVHDVKCSRAMLEMSL